MKQINANTHKRTHTKKNTNNIIKVKKCFTIIILFHLLYVCFWYELTLKKKKKNDRSINRFSVFSIPVHMISICIYICVSVNIDNRRCSRFLRRICCLRDASRRRVRRRRVRRHRRQRRRCWRRVCRRRRSSGCVSRRRRVRVPLDLTRIRPA